MIPLAPAQIDAQTLLEKISISGTAYQQGATSTNATTSTTKPPSKFSFTKAKILEQLVADEYSYGNFTSASVPKGAVLNFNGTGFEIDQGSNQLADVSADGILAWSESGQNDINAGAFLEANGPGTSAPPYNQTDYYLATVTYASPPTSSNSWFFTVTGLATVTEKTTNPNQTTGNYTQSASVSFSDGTGEGENSNGPFVVTGFTITGSGSGKANDGQGTN